MYVWEEETRRGTPNKEMTVWMGFTFYNLIYTHLPDYFLGGAWEHKTQINVSLQKEEVN